MMAIEPVTIGKAESGLVFYRRMLREMKIAVPKWLDTVTKDKTKKRKVHNPFKPSSKGGMVDERTRGYHWRVGAGLCRNTPKRDKSISARQWRIRRNRLRQAIAATKGPSGLPYRPVQVNRPA